jgi:hypothetical protein
MHRREFLTVTATAFGTSSVAGCLGRQSSPGVDGTPPESTPTTTPTQNPVTPDTATSTTTPTSFPDTCQPLPDIDGLPERPTKLTEDSVRSYVTEFERVYAVATKSQYEGIASIRVTHTETIGDRYRVQLEVEGEPVTPTAGPDGRTSTPMPVDAYAHRALYRLEGDRMVRELRGHAGGRRLSSDCWILSTAET